MSNELFFHIDNNGKVSLNPLENTNPDDTAKFLQFLETSNCVGKVHIHKKMPQKSSLSTPRP